MFKLCCSQSNVHPSPPITKQLLATKYKDFFVCRSFRSKAMLSGCTAVTEDGLGPWLHDGVSQSFFFFFPEDSFSPVHTMARGSFARASTITGNPQIWRHDLDCHGNYARKGHEICDETGPAGKQFAKHHNNKVNLMAEHVTV